MKLTHLSLNVWVASVDQRKADQSTILLISLWSLSSLDDRLMSMNSDSVYI